MENDLTNDPTVNSLGDSKANVFLIDPNPPGRGIYPPEDLFMYVNLRAIRRDRSVIQSDGSTSEYSISQTNSEGEINFIATEVPYGSDGKTIINNGRSYATTSWTDIGGKIEEGGSGILEGFGINSINISYGASLVPQVDITFTDIRGASLFDTIESGVRGNSPYYSAFFTMPYPVFQLTVKGYYGKAVSYCLHMVNWTSDFDGSTGNFTIKAKFLGFQQAFLADMVLGNVIGVVNTSEGQSSLAELPLRVDEAGNNIPTPKLDDFLNKVGKLPLLTEELKAEAQTFKELKDINTKVTKLKNILDFIGVPIQRDDKDETKNNTIQVRSSGLPSGWLDSDEYVSVRDCVIVKEDRRERFRQYADKALELFVDYQKTYDETIEKNIFSPNDNDDVSWSQAEFYGDTKEKKNFISLYDILSVSGQSDNDLEPVRRWKEEDFVFSKLRDRRGSYFGDGKFGGEDGAVRVFAIDFYEMRRQVQDVYDANTKIRDKKQEKVIQDLNDKLSEKIGFNPTLKEVFTIIMNNTQAMLDVIYKVSLKAEGLAKDRADALFTKGIITDVEGNYIYAWPEIIQEETKTRKEKTTKWLGSIFPEGDSDRSKFPEIDFVDEVVNSYVSATGRIKKTKDIIKKQINEINTGVYPIIPGHIDTQYQEFNFQPQWEESKFKEIPESLLLSILSIPFYAKGISNFEDKKIKEYSVLESSSLCLEVYESQYRDTLQQNLSKISVDQLINYGKQNGLFAEVNGEYVWGEDSELVELDGGAGTVTRNIGVYNSGDFEEVYVHLPNTAEHKTIVNNSIPVAEGVVEKNKKNIEIISKYENDNDIGTNGIKIWNATARLPKHIISYLVFGDTIKNKIGIPKKNEVSLYKFKIDDIKKIDGDAPAGEGNIGILSKDNPNLFDSTLYGLQTDNKSKALLLLNTFPFENPSKIIPLFEDVAKIIELPKLYLLWIAGSIWRYENSDVNNDVIDWGTTSNPVEVGSVPINNFIYSVGIEKNKVYGDNREIPTNILNLNPKTKQAFIKYYEDWVSSEYNKFTNDINTYLNSVDVGGSKSIVRYLERVETIVSVTPSVWKNVYGPSKVKTKLVKDSVTLFLENYKKCDSAEFSSLSDVAEEATEKNETVTNNDLKNVFYKYFKNMYDKWIGGTSDIDGKAYNICSGYNTDKKLIDYFKFINRSWCDIGDEAAINLSSVLSLSSNYDGNIYFYISKILRDSNFLFQILPSYINFRNPNDAKDIFKPITNIDKVQSSPTYVCIQAGGNSKVLDIPKNPIKSDSFIFSSAGDENQLPDEFTNCAKPREDENDEASTYTLVAFRVAYGAENQTIFKNVSLSQQEHKETGEYFKALTNLIDNRGGTKRTYQGTDLYPIFETRSYKCKIDALGCMNIQPLMYFQLDNVPFFKGSYLITNVTHSITPNHITTNFEGVRQSVVTTPLVTEATTFLNIDLNEDNEVDYVDTTPPAEDISFSVLEPESQFTFAKLFVASPTDRGNVGRLSIPTNDSEDNLLVEDLFTDTSGTPSGENTIFATTLKDTSFNIIKNAQVSMFLSSILYESDNLSKKEEVISEESANKKYKNLFGNTDDGDGYKFRGRGYKLIIGRDLYNEMSGDAIFTSKLDPQPTNSTGGTASIIEDPDVIARSSKNALLSACWYWAKQKEESTQKTFNELSKDGKLGTFSLMSKSLDGTDNTNNRRIDVLSKVLFVLDIKNENSV